MKYHQKGEDGDEMEMCGCSTKCVVCKCQKKGAKHILADGMHKFILAKNNQGENIVISMEITAEDSVNNPGHRQIYEAYAKRLEIVEVLGGGLLAFFPKFKAILLGGKSGTYGEADMRLVKELLLQDARYSDYRIKGA